MHLATFSLPEAPRHWGLRSPHDDSVIIDLTAARETFPALPVSVRELVALAPDAISEAIAGVVTSGDHTVSIGDVTFDAPLDPVRNVFAMGANYAGHVQESEHSTHAPERPIVFTKATTSVTGSGDIIVDPALTGKVDWEVELAVVLATGGRYLDELQAMDAVFGYMTANDLSARDQQHGRPEGQWFLGKSLDDFCPLGPWLVTADEIADPADLTLRLSVNDVVKQEATTAELIFPISRIISELSQFITLLPGDIILTGTPAGVGDARSPQEYLHDGDVVRAEVVGLGELVNRIVFSPRVSR